MIQLYEYVRTEPFLYWILVHMFAICTDNSVGVTPKVGQNQMCIYNFNMSSINVILIDTLTNCWLYEHALGGVRALGI